MRLILALVFGTTALAQTGTLPLSSPQPTGVTDSSASNVGIAQGGGTDIYYWVFARLPGGYVAPRTPAVARRTFGPTLLSVSNYVRVAWSSVPGATGYDVLRSTSAIPPFLPCTCAVALNVVGGPVLDTGASLSAYPPIASHGQANGTIIINNRDEAQPFLNLRMVRNGIETLTRLLELSGTPAEDDCLKFSGGRAASAGAPCGAGGGGALPAGAGLVVHLGGGVVAARTIVASNGISCVDADGVGGNPTCVADPSVLLTKVEGQRGNIYTGTTTGTSTAFALMLTPCPDAYYEGMEIRPHLHVASGATPTMNVCSLGAKKMYRRVLGSAPVQVAANDASANVHLLVFDASLDGAAGGWLVNLPNAGGSAPATQFAAFSSRSACDSSATGKRFYADELSLLHWECDGSTWQPIFAGHLAVLPPAASTWTAVGGMTVADVAGVIRVASGASNNGTILKAVPSSAPYSVELEIAGYQFDPINNGGGCGIAVANGTSTSSNLYTLTGAASWDRGLAALWFTWTTYSSGAVQQFSKNYFSMMHPTPRIKYRYTGSAHEMYLWSGSDWNLVSTLSGGITPSHWGVYCSFWNTGGAARATVYHWKEGT